jgi:hypothetical protein
MRRSWSNPTAKADMALTRRGLFLAASPGGPGLRAMSLKCQERITRWITGMRRKEKFLAIDAV